MAVFYGLCRLEVRAIFAVRFFCLPSVASQRKRNFCDARGSINQQARGEDAVMSSSFKVGDAVRWNSEAGEIHGKVVKVHTRDTEFMGRHRPATKDAPQYEVKSDKTGHLAMHHGDALKHV